MRRVFSLCCAFAVFGLTGCFDDTSDFGLTSAFVSTEYVEPPVKPRSTWAAKILKDGKIPSRGFLAAYFNRSHSSPRFHTEEVESVAVKYSWSDLHNIRSEDFAGYSIGQINVEQSGKRTISVSEGHSKSRVFINGKQVYPANRSQAGVGSRAAGIQSEGWATPQPRPKGRKGEFTHYFERGLHLVEVEHINNWHTTEFKMTIGDDEQERLPDDVLRQSLNGVGGDGIVYVGLYESADRDTSVDVSLPRYGKPVTVWLDSYEGIDWSINAPSGIAAVVIASYSPGSRVAGIGDAKVFRAQSYAGIRNITGSSGCSCHSGLFHCERSADGSRLDEVIAEKTGKKLKGAVTHYSASEVIVRNYGDRERKKARLGAQKVEEARRKCEAKANPDFDTMLDERQTGSSSTTSGWGVPLD